MNEYEEKEAEWERFLVGLTPEERVEAEAEVVRIMRRRQRWGR